ncbi:phage tail spike protein [Clostridium polynesiense]|uniref:phage tail spike protein n=1 Tax=Clostridium polynesiense TaxID=1325933 RepID=UPI00058B804E|nr:phage tail spike protein [Clostridium polynesiense]
MRYIDIGKIDYNNLELYKYYELESKEEVYVNRSKNVKVYNGDETDFTHNGITTLINLTSCFITEELNGSYFIELECIKDKTNKHLALQPLNIIKADGQLFRIPFRENIQENGFKTKITANHIFYDLDFGYLPDITLTDASIAEVMDYVLGGTDKFSLEHCDIEGNHQSTFDNMTPLQGIFQKVLKLWGGELYRDNFNIAIKEMIGRNTDIIVSYGKNILGFNEIVDCNSITTRAYPMGKDRMTIASANNGVPFIDSPRIYNYPLVFERRISFSEVDDPGLLIRKTEALWGEIDIPKTTYKVKIADLARTREYDLIKSFITLNIGDVVTIRHKIFDVELRAKVIKLKKNILLGTIEEIELGQFLPTLFNKINSMTTTIGQAEQAIHDNSTIVDSVNENLGAVTSGLLDRPTFTQTQGIVNNAIENIDLSFMVDNNTFSGAMINVDNKIKSVDERIDRFIRRKRMGIF